MAEKIFKGFELITEANFNSLTSKDKQKIYFVRTSTGTTKEDGFIYFNGKKYGTGKLSSDKIQTQLTALQNKVNGHIDNPATVTATARTSGSTDNGTLSVNENDSAKWLSGAAIAEIKKYVDSEDVKKMVLTGNKIQLQNKSDVVLAELDATSFIKDGMLQSVTLVNDTTKGNVLRFTWNTDSGKDKTTTDIEVSDFFHEISGDNNTITVTQPESGTTGSLQISAKTVANHDEVTSGSTALITAGTTAMYVGRELSNARNEMTKTISLSSTKNDVTYASAKIAQFYGTLKQEDSSLVLNVATGLTRGHIGFNFNSVDKSYSAGTTDFAGKGLLDATEVVTILQENNANIVLALDYLKSNIYTVSTVSPTIIGVSKIPDESAIGRFTYQISAGTDLTDAITHANSAVQRVNGKSGTSVTINSSEIKLGKGISGHTTADSVTTVLDDIYDKLSQTSSNALTSVSGSTSINVTAKKNGSQTISVNAKSLNADEKAAGQIEIITTGTTGIYGLLYFGGDDVE